MELYASMKTTVILVTQGSGAGCVWRMVPGQIRNSCGPARSVRAAPLGSYLALLCETFILLSASTSRSDLCTVRLNVNVWLFKYVQFQLSIL